MRTKRTRWWPKSAALLCATVFGLTAFGAKDQIWSGGASGSWSDASKWTDGTYESGNYVVNDSTQDVAISFDSATTIDTGLWIENGGTHTVTFSGTGSAGLTAGSFNIGTGTGAGNLKLASGQYVSTNDVVMSNGGTGILTLEGGTLTCGTAETEKWFLLGDATTQGSFDSTVNLNADGVLEVWHFQRYTTGGDCTINFNGGTLRALGESWSKTLVGEAWPDNNDRKATIVVGANGGTIDTNGKSIAITAPVTGTGTLTVTGGGKATFTVVPESTVTITAAEGTTIDVAKDEPFTWTGAADAENENGYFWATPGNWSIAGVVATTAPAADSTVVIPEGDGTELTIKVGGSDCTGILTINRDVKFLLAADNSGIKFTSVTGEDHTLTLEGKGSKYLAITGNGNPTLNCNVKINNWIRNTNGATFKVMGGFSGSGTVNHADVSSTYPGFEFYGDTSAFSGSYSGGRLAQKRDGTRLYGDARGSATGAWSLGVPDSYNRCALRVSDTTYYFGSLNTIHDGQNCFDTFIDSKTRLANATLVIGGRADSTSNFGGTLYGTNNKIVKVGATSTLNVTLTNNAGALEAQAGTLNLLGTVPPASCVLTGTGASITVAKTVGTYETTTVEHPAVEDNPETEENEAQDAWTETITTQTAGFVPTLSTELAGYTMVATENVENEEVVSTTYALVKTVKDANDVAYYTVAEAIAALAEAADKTITLIANSSEAVALPLGYTLVMNDFTVASVAGVPGVAVSYDETTQTYTTVNNAAATWTGAVNNWWHEAGNWSTGYVPNEGTDVTFENTATVWIYDYSGDNGNSLHKCKDINIGKCTVTLRFPNNGTSTQANSWPRLDVYGDIVGTDSKTNLKLFRCGIRNMKGSGIGISKCHVVYENDGEHDSWLEGGDFTFSDFGVSGTGFLRLLGGTYTFSGGAYCGIEILEGSTVECTKAPHFSHSTETLTGSGRIVIHDLSTLATRFQNALKNANNWSGTCELAGTSISGIDAANYGNANSTVCFNGVSGYLRAGEGVEVGNVKTIEIGANGLTLNNQYTSGAVKNYLIKADLTGTGAIKFGTKHQLSDKSKYVFTGDVSGFTGAINYGDLDSYRACVYFADSSITTSDFGSLTVPTDWGQIIVEEGKTVNVAATWYGAGGWLINGTVNVTSTGSLTCDSNGAKVGGTGTINYAALPTATPTWNTTAWTGTVVLPATEISTKTGLPLPALSSANGTLVIKGITRSDASKSLYLGGGATCTIAGTTQLDGNLHITDGNSNATYTWNKITGTGDILFTTAGGSASGITHAITRLDGYTGTIDVGGNAKLTLGTVAVDTVEVGTPLVKLSSTCVMADAAVAAVAVEVGGEALEGASVVKTTDGLYIAAAAVTVTPEEGDPVTTPYATYDAAVAAADEAGVTTVTVLYGDGAVNGWDYNSETGKLTKNAAAIARVGTTNYNSLEAAFAAAGEDDTVVLFGTSAENVTVGESQTLVVEGAYTGTLSGFGTVDAKVVTTPAGFSSWTGTFVLDWDTSAATDSTAWELNNYGVSGSTVVIARPITKGYIKAPVSGSKLHNVAPAVYLKANVLITNGFATNPDAENPVDQTTTFSQLGADEGVTLSFRYLASAQVKDTTLYAITKLKDFAGSFVLNAYNQVTVESVELAATPAFGTKIVSATVADTASLTGKIAEGYPLVFKDDGLYFDPVAQVGTAYYNTLAEAITAANGATVTLVGDTADGYEVQAGQTVKIFWNGHTTGEFTFAANTFGQKSLYDETTDTTTFSCAAPSAYATVGGTVTYYATVMEAYNAANAGAVGDSFTVLSGETYGDIDGFTYDSETATYTKVATIASITVGVTTYNYTTLANAVAAAKEHEVTTVTLLVAKDSIEEAVPEGWEYNTPEASKTEFGTLTKVVAPQPITVDTDGCDFTVDATTAAAITTATGVKTTDANFGKAAIAYVVGGELEEGEVVIPTPTIKVSGTTVTVVYDSETAHADAYTVTCTLYSFSLEDANDSTKWTVEATGAIGDALEDTGVTDTKKFYKVGVTVEDKDAQVGNETGSGQGA